MLDRWFELTQHGTTVRRELRGACATFLTMAYILVANPAILSNAGIPAGPLVACTALAAGVCSIAMGIRGNFPIALASGMGLNALIAYTATAATGSWQIAMGLVVLDGLIISALVLLGLREAMLHAIPTDLRRATAAGIGLFIALIGCVNSGLVTSSGLPVPPLAPGEFLNRSVLITLCGVCLIAALLARRIPGAVLIGIVTCAIAAQASHMLDAPATTSEPVQIEGSDIDADAPESGSTPASKSWWPSFEIIGQADVWGALRIQYLPLLLTLMMVDFFDTLGTVTAVHDQLAHQPAPASSNPAGQDTVREPTSSDGPDSQIPRLKQILLVDSLSAAVGGWMGVSSVTSYIESAAGVSDGARTGLHSVFVGIMFLVAIFAAPLIVLIPAEATAPALIVVGSLMATSLQRIDFHNPACAIPAFVTTLTIPATWSISHGIGYGIISFVLIHLLLGRHRQIHPLLVITAMIFAAAFVAGS